MSSCICQLVAKARVTNVKASRCRFARILPTRPIGSTILPPTICGRVRMRFTNWFFFVLDGSAGLWSAWHFCKSPNNARNTKLNLSTAWKPFLGARRGTLFHKSKIRYSELLLNRPSCSETDISVYSPVSFFLCGWVVRFSSLSIDFQILISF